MTVKKRVELNLFGKPVAWSASRVSGSNHYNPRSKEKNAFQWQIKSQYRNDPLTGYYRIYLTFFEPIPASTPEKIRALMLRSEIIPTNQDCTNCQKFFEDCLKGIVIDDDRYVDHISSTKRYAEEAKIHIIVDSWGKRREEQIAKKNRKRKPKYDPGAGVGYFDVRPYGKEWMKRLVEPPVPFADKEVTVRFMEKS